MKTGDTFSKDQVTKYIDCEVYVRGEWRSGYKFIQRSLKTCLVLNLCNGTWIAIRYKCMDVRVIGVELPFLDRYTSFNPKKPFQKKIKPC